MLNLFPDTINIFFNSYGFLIIEHQVPELVIPVSFFVLLRQFFHFFKFILACLQIKIQLARAFKQLLLFTKFPQRFYRFCFQNTVLDEFINIVFRIKRHHFKELCAVFLFITTKTKGS